MDSSSTVFIKIGARGVAGASETLITYPAEFAKTRRQLSSGPPPSSFALLYSTISRYGFGGIYAGCAALALSNAVKSGIRFLAFETARARLDAAAGTLSGQPRSVWINVASGLTAGVAEGILVVTPGEAVKTKMIHAASKSHDGAYAGRSLGGVTTLLVRQEGIRALWAGLSPVLCKQGTNSAVRFTTLTMLQEQVAKW